MYKKSDRMAVYHNLQYNIKIGLEYIFKNPYYHRWPKHFSENKLKED